METRKQPVKWRDGRLIDHDHVRRFLDALRDLELEYGMQLYSTELMGLDIVDPTHVQYYGIVSGCYSGCPIEIEYYASEEDRDKR